VSDFVTEEQLKHEVRILDAAFHYECQRRHELGEKKYGPIKFLESDNDLLRMLQEELVDAANYARYLWVRIEMLRSRIEEQTAELQDTPLGRDGIVVPHGD